MTQAIDPVRLKAKRKKNIGLWLLIVVGVVLTLYGLAETWHHTSKLYEQGNQTAAEAAWERFALVHLGGWIGAGVALFIRSGLVKFLKHKTEDAQ